MAEKAGKITVVGAGTIGTTIAYSLMIKELASEIVLINRDRPKGEARAMDLSHCGPLTGGARVSCGDFEAAAESEIVVVTVGMLADKNGTRMDVLESNINMFRDIIPRIAKYSPEAAIIVVTNPLDAMTYAAYRLSGFPASRVIGSGTLLDTVRFRQILASRLDAASADVEAEVIGEHGDSMVPVWSRVRVCGIPLTLPPDIKSEIEKDIERAGWNIRLGNVHSCYGIALSVVRIIECMLGFSKQAVPVSSVLSGEYGISNVPVSVPAYLDRKGIKRFDIIELCDNEKKLLAESAEIVAGYVREAEIFL